MSRTFTNVIRVASAPVGVGIGLWTASLWIHTSNDACALLLMCSPGPRFALWQCALFGAGAAVLVLLFSRVANLTDFLRVGSVPLGFVIAVWTAQLLSPYCPPLVYGQCPSFFLTFEPTFAVWQCVLFGVGAAVVALLLSLVVARLASTGSLRAA
jgi:hypothetical protein